MPTWKAYAKKDDITATKLDDLAAPDDNTDLNATAAAHGLLPKLSNVATEYLSGTGVFSVPAGGGPTIVRKTADEIVYNSNTLQNDDHLLFAVAANEIWEFEVFIIGISAASTTPDIKVGWSVPTGASMLWNSIEDVTENNALPETYPIVLPQSTGKTLRRLSGVVIVGATAGNVNMMWAQNTKTAENTKILTNSHIIAHKLA